jgi:multidrug efflux pump subunit AcrA (membrane-fusion protein)
MKIILSLVLIVSAVLVAWWWFPRGAAAHQAVAHTVRAEFLPTHLDEHVFITSADRQPVPTLVSGTITWVVEHGSAVRAGDLVARIDPADKAKRREQMAEDQERDRTTLERYQTERELAELTTSNEDRITEADLAYAQLRIEKRVQAKGLSPSDRRMLAIDLKLKAIDLQEAEEKLERDRRMREKGLLSASQLQSSQRRFKARQAALEEKQTEITLAEAGPDASEQAELQAELARAQGREARSQARLQRWLERIDQDIAIQQARIERRQAQLAQLDFDLAHMDVHAPVDGIAMVRQYRDWAGGGRLVRAGPGMTRNPGDPLVDIIDPEQVQAVMMVGEMDFPLLKENMAVELELAAYPGECFTGNISFLAGIARDRGAIRENLIENDSTGVNVFSAVIQFKAPLSLRPGMTGLARVPLDYEERLLVIPRDLVQADDEGHWVWLLQDGEPRRQPVHGEEYGRQGWRVSNGLRDGDRLLTAGGTG